MNLIDLHFGEVLLLAPVLALMLAALVASVAASAFALKAFLVWLSR